MPGTTTSSWHLSYLASEGFLKETARRRRDNGSKREDREDRGAAKKREERNKKGKEELDDRGRLSRQFSYKHPDARDDHQFLAFELLSFRGVPKGDSKKEER